MASLETDYIDLSEYADIPPCTPGDVLKEEFLIPRKESILDLKIKTDIPSYELDALIDGTGIINEDMADKLAEYFHNSPEFWTNLQKQYDEDNLKLQKGCLALKIEEILLGESKDLEFKEKLPEDSKKYMKTIVAFSNGHGDRFIIGVNDEREVVEVD